VTRLLSPGARCLAVALLLLVVVAPVGVVATPQGGNTTTTTNATADEPDEIVGYVDDRLRITAYRYNASTKTMFVTLENTGTGTSSVTLTEAIEAGDDSGGSSSFGIKTIDVESGETVTVSLKLRTDASTPGVMVTTERSVEQGKGQVVWADQQEQNLIKGEATWADDRSGVGAGIGGTVVIGLAAAWHVVAQRNKDYEEKAL
jgi:archaellum component FlaF (FlaF/FlaG flagellin family)